VTSPTPIADALDNNETSNASENDLPRRPYRVSDSPNIMPDPDARFQQEIPQPDFLGSLLDAQKRLIDAQHNFLHDSDLARLFQAQDDFIGNQSQVILRLLGKT
jgi:hypothetical protein